jgi:translation initiation factor IF-2
MHTRQLRLGDVVDDYCPRERRLSNHVVVAMVEDAIKQTRCSTCDFEHPYKDGKVPPKRKKKDAPSALFQQVLDGVMEGRVLSPAPALVAPPAAPAPVAPPVVAAAPPPPAPVVAVEEAAPLQPLPPRRKTRVRVVPEEPVAAAPAAAAAPVLRGVLRPANGPTAPPQGAEAATLASAAPATPSSDSVPSPSQESASEPMAVEDPEDGPLYRRNLIRATLPRAVGDVPVRQMPTFTIREAAAARPNKFRPKHRPQGVGMGAGPRQHGGGNQLRQTSGRGPQGGRPAGGKKSGGAPNHSGNQAHGGKNRQGGHGNKRFK